jgi:hypothetical protein
MKDAVPMSQWVEQPLAGPLAMMNLDDAMQSPIPRSEDARRNTA